MFQKLSSSELAERTRWEERNGNPSTEPSSFDEFVMLGLGDFDAFIDFLEKKAVKAGKGDSFFSARHHAVQEAMDDLKKHYANVGKGPL